MRRTPFVFCALLALSVCVTGRGVAQERIVTLPECTAPGGSDADDDGLSDACEQRAALELAPVFVIRTDSCNRDASAAPARLAGGYFFAVQRIDSAVRVAYLPAYFRDCGWRGAKCRLPWVDCTPHAGDSEFVVVEIQRTGQHDWMVTGVFLSAHCFGRSSASCRWYRAGDLAQFEWLGAAPVVWVAEGRHANYPSWQACDRGHHFVDTCDRHDVRYRFPVSTGRNLGSRAHPATAAGCVGGDRLGHPDAHPAAVECFWSAAARFGGWQIGGPGVTPYERYLREIAGF